MIARVVEPESEIVGSNDMVYRLDWEKFEDHQAQFCWKIEKPEHLLIGHGRESRLEKSVDCIEVIAVRTTIVKSQQITSGL